MGQEIANTHFSEHDFRTFRTYLENETSILSQWFNQNLVDSTAVKGGFEIESWILDSQYNPAYVNDEFLELFDSSLATPELARFNLEFNNYPRVLTKSAISEFHKELENTWSKAQTIANNLNPPSSLLLIGTLPSLKLSDLTEQAMSDMNRYRALNHEIMRRRNDKPVNIYIQGYELLDLASENVMLEASTTSFQIHTQVPSHYAHHYYNAALMVSGPMMAITGNSPYLFGKDLWCESRIPMFEQAIDTDNSDAPIKRVSFGSGFIKQSILECFQENLDHFYILLPIVEDDDNTLKHLRLHNGTIWRWNRPLIGFNENGQAHCRIEHRPLAAGPTIIDMIANAALYFGLQEYWAKQLINGYSLPDFEETKTNFYTSARFGMSHSINWYGKSVELSDLFHDLLLPQAENGLKNLGINKSDIRKYLHIIKERVNNNQTGANWQRKFTAMHKCTVRELISSYQKHQRTGAPVHTWDFL